MKTLPNTASLLASETIDGLARAVVITRTDGIKVGFAERTAPTYGGVTFSENVLVETGSITLTANDTPSRVDLTIALPESGPITLADVQDGIYEGASVEILIYNANTPTGADLLYWGDIGAISYTNLHVLNLQLNGPLARIKNWTTELYGPSCRAFFTDSRCGISAASVSETGTITSADGRNLTVSGITSTTDQFKLGLVTMTSGALKGRKREVKSSGAGLVELYAGFGRDPAAGDTFTIRRGCSYDLSATTGCVYWNNIRNYRGEPFLDDDAATATVPQGGKDPYSSTVLFLAGFNGLFLDEAKGASISTYGSPSAAGSPKFGSNSLSLSASSYLSVGYSRNDWYFRDGQFTIEAWVNFSSTTGDQAIMAAWAGPVIPSYRSWRFGFYPTSFGGLAFQFRDFSGTGTHLLASTWAPTPGTWHHVVVDRKGGWFRIYADGVMLAKIVDGGFLVQHPFFALTIGAEDSPTPASYMTGSIDELRVSKGLARYGSDSGYTVPTAAFPRPV